MIIEDMFSKTIMDSLYEKQDLQALVQKQKHLSDDQRKKLGKVFEKYEDLMQGHLGKYPGDPIHIELVKNAKPQHCGQPMRIPHTYKDTLAKEVKRLIEIGVLERVYEGEAGPWCAPAFCVPKKDGRIRFVTDYRRLNKFVKRRP